VVDVVLALLLYVRSVSSPRGDSGAGALDVFFLRSSANADATNHLIAVEHHNSATKNGEAKGQLITDEVE